MTPCKPWVGQISPEGYGRLTGTGHHRYAHRAAWEQANGPIPAGMQIDHLCRNRRCVEVTHLEAVTQAENLRRGTGFSGRNARKTHCVRGHEFTPENTMVRPNGYRCCRACYRLVARARRHGEPIEVYSPRLTGRMA